MIKNKKKYFSTRNGNNMPNIGAIEWILTELSPLKYETICYFHQYYRNDAHYLLIDAHFIMFQRIIAI